MKTISKSVAGNPENEDRALVLEGELQTALCVADGAGGVSGGAAAANLAIQMVREHGGELHDGEACARLLEEMDDLAAQDGEVGETTCAVAVVQSNHIVGASVGDSGVWIVHENGFVNLTHQQETKPFIGSGNAWPVAFTHKREPGQILLLATDGLLKYTTAEQIMAACREMPEEAAVERLTELVRYKSGALPDDVTVILARL